MTEATTGYGQQGPFDTSSDYNHDLFVIWQQLAKISTVKVVQVQSVQAASAGGGTVSVQIMTNQLDGAGNATPHGTISGIPYFQSQWGANAIIGTPAVGDIGIMVCADRDISAVKSTQAVANPGSERQLDPADGIYLGGILNQQAVKQWFKFTETGISIQDANNNTIVSGPSGGWTFNQVTVTGVLTAQQNLQLGGNLVSQTGTEYAGTIQTSGDVIAGAISVKNHVHVGVQPGSGNTGAATG